MTQSSVLDAYLDDVLKFGAEAVLPSNLSDSWLAYLCQQAPVSDTNDPLFTSMVASVIAILSAENGGAEVEIREDELNTCLAIYRTELTLEKVRRSRGKRSEPVTIQTIFRKPLVMGLCCP